MTEERFGGDECHRRDVLQAGLLDLVVRVEHELVGGAETRAALRGADHDRAGVAQESVPLITGEQSVLEVADRLRVPVVRTEAGDPLKRQPRTRADEQPVIDELLARARRHRVRSRVDRLGRLIDEPDPLAGIHGREREGHILLLTATERQPDQGRNEREVRPRIEHHDLVAIAHLLLELERCGQSREARSDDHDTLALRTGHDSLLPLRRHASVGWRWPVGGPRLKGF